MGAWDQFPYLDAPNGKTVPVKHRADGFSPSTSSRTGCLAFPFAGAASSALLVPVHRKQNAVQQGLRPRGAARDVDVHGNNSIDAAA